MNDYKIDINLTGDISWIIEAAVDLSEATEADLQAIKEKKWYKRLLDIITFSKDNQIQVAKDIGSLAKLQEIMIRVLAMLSQENAAISTTVRQQAELLKGLSCKDTALQNAIKKIKFGGTTQIDFSDLDREKKALIASLLIMADSTAQRNEYSRQYFGSILTVACMPSYDNTVKPTAVESLKHEEQELLYRMILIGRLLMDIPFDEPSEILDCISISKKRKDEIQRSIIDTASAVSLDFFAAYYEKTNEVVDEISSDDILFDPVDEEITSDREKDAADEEENQEAAEETPQEKQANEGEDDVRGSDSELSRMVKHATNKVNEAAVMVTVICNVPIPASLLIEQEVALMTNICKIFKIAVKKDDLKALVYATFGSGSEALIEKATTASMYTVIPIVNWIAGAISAGTARPVTMAIGNSFIELCKAVKSGELKEDEIATVKGQKIFEQIYKAQNKKK